MSAPESQPAKVHELLEDGLQERPDPPLAALHFPDVPSVRRDVALGRGSPVAMKLHLLLHAHTAAAGARRRVLWLRVILLAAAILVAIPLAILAGVGMYSMIYNDPHRHVQEYSDAWTRTYYVRGEKATRQQYDYYLKTGGNEGVALAGALLTGLLVFGVVVGVLWLLLRPRRPVVALSVDEQIAAIAKDHPDAVQSWGGPWVLRVPQLIEQILDLDDKNAK